MMAIIRKDAGWPAGWGERESAVRLTEAEVQEGGRRQRRARRMVMDRSKGDKSVTTTSKRWAAT